MKKIATSINVITLGCSKNIVDSEILLGNLKRNDFIITHDSDNPADIVVINTCGFIQDAKEESIDTIIRYIQAKKDNLVKKLYVMGCLSERYKEELKKDIPEVDGFFGVNEFDNIIKELKKTDPVEFKYERHLTTPKHFAYLKIAEGCDRKCSFCAIPLIRGKHISRPIEEIIEEAKTIVEKGVKEIIVISQDTTFYGLDLYKKRRLGELLERLSEIKGLEWIRLQYTYPADFPGDVLDVMATKSNICNYLDVPLQHISNHLLKS
ncbi:MAG: MiaB/RimO family radical SAM methylthiotransferase, partial [Saprospiraceae bacterium]|nr:MiaB/RimO family radical SAM methylthiotransferase [Saprospiraceae bacterium]